MNFEPATTMDETAITEITIRPDGRIYVFGLSREVVEALAGLWPRDSVLQSRLAPIGQGQPQAALSRGDE
jgi:hypothetical protein